MPLEKKLLIEQKKQITELLNGHHKEIKAQVVEKLATLITAGFALVAALAWNDAIKAIFKEIFGAKENIAAMLTYAVIVTLIAVILTIWIGRISEKAKTSDSKKKK
jgi:uncharacterized BrkB/YihY/UPF0761 family membrane protein